MIPGENHTRDLDYTPTRICKDQAQADKPLNMYWQGIGFEGHAYLPVAGDRQEVQLVKVERMNKEDGFHLGLQVQVEYSPLGLQESYYEVPAKTRWKFGIAYLGLNLVFAVYD